MNDYAVCVLDVSALLYKRTEDMGTKRRRKKDKQKKKRQGRKFVGV